MANMVTNAKTYAKITGLALAAVALLGIVMNVANKDGVLVKDFLVFDWTHNIVHVVLAAVALWVGFGNLAGNYVSMYAKVFGIVYFALGIVGFIPGVVNGLNTALTLHLELGENLVHLVIGAWGIVAGFMGASSGTTGTSPIPMRR